ncbi:hypothetical protein VTJ04DRAFT_2109 [Mycothermus thermophilus]
MSIYDEKG